MVFVDSLRPPLGGSSFYLGGELFERCRYWGGVLTGSKPEFRVKAGP